MVMDEDKFYLTMSAVGSTEEIVHSLHEILDAFEKTITLHEIKSLTTYGKGQVLMCSKKSYTV